MKIAVTGANSSVGRNLLAHVAAGGDVMVAGGGVMGDGGEVMGAGSDLSVIAGVRSESAAASLPTSPRIIPRVISYDDVGELTKTLEGVSCLVHLAGILIESRASTYASANVAATAAVVEASQEAGVQHIVLISVLGASADSPNRFLKSKGEAEKAMAESGISSTILRTPILLGPGTAGAAALVGTASRGKARLLGGGRNEMRPLDVDDLSRAILRLCETRPEGASIHELVGPESIAYRDLIERVAGMMGKELSMGSIPIWVAKLGAAFTSRLNGRGFSPTVIDVITTNEVVQKNADADLGIHLTPLSTTLEKILPETKQSTEENST